MDQKLLDKISSECPREYLEFLLWHYRVVDAFWFIRVEEQWGLGTAETINERVWGKCTELAARRIKEQFAPGGGIEGFKKALEYLPWTILVGYELEDRDEELILSVPHCPPQEARIKRGIGEYACKAMQMAEFEAFARTIDPRIRVECLFAPPDEHPDELFCKWRFTVLPLEA
jgi:hypothetical protein